MSESFNDFDRDTVSNYMQVVPTQRPMRPFPTLPSKIKVGFKTYEVRSMSSVEVMDDDALGKCEHQTGVIRVFDIRHDRADVAETLLHEILHAAWFVGRIHEADDEERTVAALSHVLAQTLADNPKLRAYFEAVYG